MILFNPNNPTRFYPDEDSRQIMLKTIAFFEEKGKGKVKEDDRKRVWYADFIEFQKKEKLFATLLTPTPYGEGRARAGTPGATASSTRSWASTGWPTGTPGRCRSWGWGRSG